MVCASVAVHGSAMLWCAPCAAVTILLTQAAKDLFQRIGLTTTIFAKYSGREGSLLVGCAKLNMQNSNRTYRQRDACYQLHAAAVALQLRLCYGIEQGTQMEVGVRYLPR